MKTLIQSHEAANKVVESIHHEDEILAIHFTDGTSVALRSSYDSSYFSPVATLDNYYTYDYMRAGLITKEEYEAANAEMAAKQLKINEERERVVYENLKKKFEGTA